MKVANFMEEFHDSQRAKKSVKKNSHSNDGRSAEMNLWLFFVLQSHTIICSNESLLTL